MEWLIENWKWILTTIVIIVCLVINIMYYIKLPKEQQISNLKEWLKWAVTEAEKSLGGGTGQLKLRMVWNMATSTFPWIVKVVSFETFSKWVDEALKWLETQLESNVNMQKLVKGEQDENSN